MATTTARHARKTPGSGVYPWLIPRTSLTRSSEALHDEAAHHVRWRFGEHDGIDTGHTHENHLSGETVVSWWRGRSAPNTLLALEKPGGPHDYSRTRRRPRRRRRLPELQHRGSLGCRGGPRHGLTEQIVHSGMDRDELRPT